MFESFELSALVITLIAGVFLGIPVGPAMFMILDTTMQVSKLAGLKVYSGFLSAKLIYAGFALLASSFLANNADIEAAFYFTASALLVVWGVYILLKSNDKKDALKPSQSGRLFSKGLMVGLSNPVIPFIYLTFIHFIRLHTSDASTIVYVAHIIMLEITIFIVLSSIIALIARWNNLIENHWNKVVKAMGIVLICAGGYQAYEMLEVKDGEVEINNDSNVLEEQLEKFDES